MDEDSEELVDQQSRAEIQAGEEDGEDEKVEVEDEDKDDDMEAEPKEEEEDDDHATQTAPEEWYGTAMMISNAMSTDDSS